MIKIDIDDREVQKMLKGLAGRVQDRRPLTRKIAGIMHDAVEENFEQEGRPKWKPSKRAKKQGGKTLQDTGLMAKVSSSYDNNSAVVGSNRGENGIIAATHHFGTSRAGRKRNIRIPARPFLKLTDGDLEEIKEAVKEHLKPR
jgi:phage virion morphogenesis protein